MENIDNQELSSPNISRTSTSTDITSENNFSKNNNQEAETDWLTNQEKLYKHKLQLVKHKLQLVEIKKKLRDTDTENINKDEKIVNELYNEVFQSLNSEYTGYKKEQEEKNKSWWQSVKDAFNRGKTEGHGVVTGFFKGCWEATKTGWSKAPTWAKVGVGAGLIAGSALCMPQHIYRFVRGGPDIFIGTSFSLQTIPRLLLRPSSWILPQNILPLTMICGGATIAGMAGKEYVDKIRTEPNMTEEEEKNYAIVHDECSTVIEKKRAFLLFLISGLNNNKDFFNDAGECFDAIKEAEDKEREKNKNINLSKNDISQSQSQTIWQSNDKIKLNENNTTEEESKNNVNDQNNIYHKENKEIKNNSKISAEEINAYNKEEKNNIINN